MIGAEGEADDSAPSFAEAMHAWELARDAVARLKAKCSATMKPGKRGDTSGLLTEIVALQ